ncbi:MAG: glycosyltransferase family 39 protein [Chloroflexota bacterium]
MNRLINTLFTSSEAAYAWLFGAAFICMFAFLVTIPLPRIDGMLIGSDGIKYYAILRSITLDRDFDFTNDYTLLNEPFKIVEDTGKPQNPFAVGSALLWLPFFLIAHVLAVGLNALGISTATEGVSYLYQAAALTGTIFYASVGFILIYQTTRRLFSVPSSLLAVLALWWAAPGIYYMIAEPSMSHGMTIFTSALFLFVWYPPREKRSAVHWVVLGFVTGLAALVRWQEMVIAIVPVVELIWWFSKGKSTWQKSLRNFLLFGMTLLIVFLPQFFMWQQIYGSPLVIPQGNDFMHWLDPKPILTLFSTRHGLLTWHPVFLLALVGLVPLWRRDKILVLVILGIFLAQLYVNSATDHWWADDAFGGRRFISLIPFFVLSLAALIDYFEERGQLRWVVTVLILLVIWNGLSFVQYRLGFVSKDEALTWQEMTVDRILLPWKMLQSFLN